MTRAKKRAPEIFSSALPDVNVVAVDTSNDGRRIRSSTTYAPPAPQPSSPSAPDPPYADVDTQCFNNDIPNLLEVNPDAEEEEEGLEGIQVTVKPARRYQNSDRPLLTWCEFRDEYLDELLRLDGRGPRWHTETCSGCKTSLNPEFRCTDCLGGLLFCKKCMVTRHKCLPLHRLMRWNGSFFEPTTLQMLGLRVQVGHPPGEPCPHRRAGHRDFVVLHINGIHKVFIDFCECSGHPPFRTQLLRAAWWPATPLEPQTCATITLLRHFHLLNLQGKLSGYDFYRALELETDGTGLMKLPDHLPAFMLMVHEFRHVKHGKRGGRGMDPAGLAETALGELAVECPACPIPGKNLPHDWERAPEEVKFLYRLILCMDACFRLSNRLRTSKANSPSLGPGWLYFQEPAAYAHHLKNYTHQDEISNCIAFAAMMLANLKKTKGMASTGVGGVCCGRHELFRPRGLGDLQKGERYANMDYIFAAATVGIIVQLVISYDIVCQWFVNFWSRMSHLPSHIRPDLKPDDVTFLVPALHIESHKEKCRNRFNSRRTRGMGRSDLEAIERLWAWIRGAAPSTKEMGPGCRRDTLDDFCAFINWLKILGMGNLFLWHLLEAIVEAVAHHRAFGEFEAGLEAQRPADVQKWKVMYEEWEKDGQKPNPFEGKDTGMKMADVRRQLAEEENGQLGHLESSDRRISPSAFLLLGLDLEHVQATLRFDLAAHKNPTQLQAAAFQERRNTLFSKVRRYREAQAIHMPQLGQMVDLDDLDPATNRPQTAEKINLHFPSGLPTAVRAATCSPSLIAIEVRLREAEASEALDDMRRYLRARSSISLFKIKNITGQRHNTRARDIQSRLDGKITTCKARYRTARMALYSLMGGGSWEHTLKPLKDEDVVGISGERFVQLEEDARDSARALVGLDVEKPSEGWRETSWIWFQVPQAADPADPGLHEALRIEWAKAKARADRWQEEVMLLDEEMRRVIAYGRWKATWWDSQTLRRSNLEPELAEGIHAYALEHAAMERGRATELEVKWADVRKQARALIAGESTESVSSGSGLVVDLMVEDEGNA